MSTLFFVAVAFMIAAAILLLIGVLRPESQPMMICIGLCLMAISMACSMFGAR